MKTILLMRHAKSSWDAPDVLDHDRPLNRRGQLSAAFMAEVLEAKQLVPQEIIGSDARRVVETIDVMQRHWTAEPQVSLHKSLYLAGAKAYVEALEFLSDDIQTAMLVAHNPGLESLISSIAEKDTPFPTAAVAVISASIDTFQSAYRSLHLWEIKTILRPKEIGFHFDE